MNIILAIMKKETYELIYSKKTFLLLFIACSIPAFVLSLKDQNYLLPPEITMVMFPIAIAYFASIQFLIYSIIDEKKQNTLEVLLAHDIRKIDIILGKVLPASIISLVFSLITFIELNMLSYFDSDFNNLQMTTAFMIILILASYLGSSVCMFATLIIPDEKSVTFTVAGVTAGLVYIFYRAYVIINITIPVICFLMILLCILMTFINSYLLKNRSDIVTKI